MRAAVLVALILVPVAGAHTYCEHGNVTTIYPDQLDTGLFSLLESLAPGSVPNGLFYYTVSGTQGGDACTIRGDDGDAMQVGPYWMPQFDAKGCDCEWVDGGSCTGTVTQEGVVVYLVFPGDIGEGFTYSEA